MRNWLKKIAMLFKNQKIKQVVVEDLETTLQSVSGNNLSSEPIRSRLYAAEYLKNLPKKRKIQTSLDSYLCLGGVREENLLYDFIYEIRHLNISEKSIEKGFNHSDFIYSQNPSSIDALCLGEAELCMKKTKDSLDWMALNAGFPMDSSLRVVTSAKIEETGQLTLLPIYLTAYIVEINEDQSPLRYFIDRTEYSEKCFYQTLKEVTDGAALIENFKSFAVRRELLDNIPIPKNKSLKPKNSHKI